MSRPVKFGLDYWPCDVDIFDDEKIAPISGEFGSKGEIILIRLLCAIYRNGYFIQWTKQLRMTLVSKMSGVNEGLVNDVVDRLVEWGFFDQALFNSSGVLTSAAIQKRYFAASIRRKAIETDEFLLIPLPEGVKPVNVCNNRVNVYKNPTSSVVNDGKSTEIKVKESKEKETNTGVLVKKEGENECNNSLEVAKKPDLETRKQEFYNSLIPFVQKYGKVMVRDFFDHWSEVSDGGKKMKWEKVRDAKNGTWNLEGRLATWKRKGEEFGSARSREKGISISKAIMSVAGEPVAQSEQPEEQGVSMSKLLGDGR